MRKTAFILSALIVFMLTTVLHDVFSQCPDCDNAVSQSQDHADNDSDTDAGQKESPKHCGHLHIFSLAGLGSYLPSFQGVKDRASIIYSGDNPLHLAAPLLQPPLQA